QAVAEEVPRISVEYAATLSFGNLRKLTLKGGNGRYTLNDYELPKVTSESTDFATKDHAFRVQVTFLKTVLISQTRPVNASNQDPLQNWARQIPVVAQILKTRDSIGSMKPVVYELREPKGRQNVKLQEELVMLWSADPADRSKIGLTKLFPPQ